MKGVFMTSGAMLYNSSKHGRTNSTEVPAHNLNANNITLYQYQSCPFCSKTRAFLDYYGIQYKKVEVNPLFKREMKFSSYKKVPFIVVDHNKDSTEGVGTIQVSYYGNYLVYARLWECLTVSLHTVHYLYICWGWVLPSLFRLCLISLD